MYREQHNLATARATRDDVEHALADWLDEHAGEHASLSAWESHCFALALTFLRFGYYDRALDQIGFVLDPPIPLPIFPMHHLMSLEQLQRAIPPSARDRSRAEGSISRGDENQDPAD